MGKKHARRYGTTLVTSGEYRGATILTPGGNTHPMGSREKIALFNMISGYLPMAFVLDAYAGSGALGIEALSRGAAFVLFIDNDPVAVRVIQQNLEDLGLYGLRGGALQKDVLKEAQHTTDRFSIVLADPPYDKYQPELITGLTRFVAEGGLLVASTPVSPPEIEGMILLKSRKYARAHITIYEQLSENGKRVEFPTLEL